MRATVSTITINKQSILEGTKNSHLEGFSLAKHTAHKHPHHDGAVCLFSGMVSMVEHTPHQEPLQKGLDKAAVKGFSIKVIIK